MSAGRGESGERAAVALIGLRCAGKTSVGEALARRLGRPFADLDREIVALAAREGRAAASAGELLAAIGEPAFRDLEVRALRAALAGPGARVLATGGGVVERAENRALLAARAICVWLRVPPAELARRMRADPSPRPALTGSDPIAEIRSLALHREPRYAELARIEVAGDAGPPDEIAAEIERILSIEGDSG